VISYKKSRRVAFANANANGTLCFRKPEAPANPVPTPREKIRPFGAAESHELWKPMGYVTGLGATAPWF